jgi:hypothetical protein
MTSKEFIRSLFRPRRVRVELHYAGRLISIYAAIAGIIFWFCVCMLICIYGAGG